MNVNIFLYDDFETLDAFGIAGVFGNAPHIFNLNYLSEYGDVVNSRQGIKVWTEIFEEDKTDDILVIPGGRGGRRLIQNEALIERLKIAIRKATLCLSISEGNVILAKTGNLYHRNAAYSNVDKEWIKNVSGGINWIKNEKWVDDGKFYTASNSMAAIDMAVDFIATQFDMSLAMKIAQNIGYYWEPGY